LSTAAIIASSNTIRQTNGQHCADASAEKILRYVEPAYPETEIEILFTRFSRNRDIRVIPVVRDRRPVGLIHRYEFVDSFAAPVRRDRLGRRLCGDVMNAKPLLVDKSVPLDELIRLLSQSDIRHFADGFVITAQGNYLGIGSGRDLLREVAAVRSNGAQQAGPPPPAPGKMPIGAYINGLPHGIKSFTARQMDDAEGTGTGRFGVRNESSGFNQHEMANVYY
jgi:CBS domain-containing protein